MISDEKHPMDRIDELQKEILERRAKMLELTRELAIGEVKDYELTAADGTPTRLSALFGDKPDLLVIQNMGRGCPYCTMWADGFVGLLPHLENRTAVALVSPDEPAVLAEFAAGRYWPFRALTSRGTSFKTDLGFSTEGGGPLPGVSAFHRDGDRIENVANDYFGPGDFYSAAWHLFPLLKDGTGDWQPRFRYE